MLSISQSPITKACTLRDTYKSRVQRGCLHLDDGTNNLALANVVEKEAGWITAGAESKNSGLAETDAPTDDVTNHIPMRLWRGYKVPGTLPWLISTWCIQLPPCVPGLLTSCTEGAGAAGAELVLLRCTRLHVMETEWRREDPWPSSWHKCAFSQV